MKALTITPAKETLELLEQYGSTPIKSGFKLADLIKRPELDYEKLAPLDKERPELPAPVREQVNIQIKYEGYISQQLKQVEQFKKLENRLLPEDLDYETIQGLRLEARQNSMPFVPVPWVTLPVSQAFPRRTFPFCSFIWNSINAMAEK